MSTRISADRLWAKINVSVFKDLNHSFFDVEFDNLRIFVSFSDTTEGRLEEFFRTDVSEG